MNKIKYIAFLVLALAMSINCQAQTRQRIVNTTSLEDYVKTFERTIPRQDSNAFIEPKTQELSQFGQIVTFIFNGEITKAESLIRQSSFETVTLNDKGKQYLVLTEKKNNKRGGGLYIFDLKYKRNIVLEVPHPISDANTEDQAVEIMKGVEARAIFIAGTHRCANQTKANNVGNTKVCSGNNKSEKFQVSDAGHYDRGFFQEAHIASVEANLTAISLHGNNDIEIADYLLSDGTENGRTNSYIVNQLRLALLDQKVDTSSCNFKSDGNFDLCGTTNIQGIYTNTLKRSYKATAKKANGKFIHIEQHLNQRNNPRELIVAIKRVF